MNEYQINRQNKKNRNIPTDNLWPEQHIGSYLRKNIKSNWNFLINGSGNNRTSTLFQRILQLYQDPAIIQRPMIVISSNRGLLNRVKQIITDRKIPRVRPFVKIDEENSYYKPFAGMNVYEIEKSLAIISESDNTMNFEEWDKIVFHAVCEVLEKYQYVLSIENLQKVFKANKQDIVQMLRVEGFQSETEKTENNFDMIVSIIDSVYQKFEKISSDDGRSLVEQVRLRKNSNRSMPCCCFNISDGKRKIFLDYLSEELRIISEICDPIIVLDSIPLCGVQNEKDYFFEYLNSAVNLSLTLSAESCDALISQEKLESFIKTKNFRMCFTKGSVSGENLTRIELGEYDHIVIDKAKGKVTETFHLISHDKHYDSATHHERRLRIRGDDLMGLSDKEAYVTYKGVAHLVMGINFTTEIK